MRTNQPLAPGILVFPETHYTQHPPTAWDGRNGRGEIAAPNDEPLGAITITRAISEATRHDTGTLVTTYNGTTFPSIFFSKFATENPPPIRQTAPHPGHSELSPAPYGSPVKPATARIIHGAMQPSKVGVNGSGFDDVFFHRPKTHERRFLLQYAPGTRPRSTLRIAMKSLHSASACFTTQFERGLSRRFTLRSSGFYKEYAHVDTGQDSNATAAFPEAVDLAFLQKTCIGEQGIRTNFWRTKSSF
ncbi:hypothetical protein CFIO01_04789 [Colletotrichum fioriniae PJ7]|uniref:Uncharacterized protein n=1 Tax=Colletotrichum fioriniae PJ7 TaxID=1445577 RepID=A0A010RMR0_9PEZI|nr:hypothetical protein CFIO01_04789 [Colletotrichum fioriniae PJ7]